MILVFSFLFYFLIPFLLCTVCFTSCLCSLPSSFCFGFVFSVLFTFFMFFFHQSAFGLPSCLPTWVLKAYYFLVFFLSFVFCMLVHLLCFLYPSIEQLFFLPNSVMFRTLPILFISYSLLDWSAMYVLFRMFLIKINDHYPVPLCICLHLCPSPVVCSSDRDHMRLPMSLFCHV